MSARVLHPLFEPLQAGELALKNRVVMAPMARRRADEAGVPSEHAPEYYAQRAGAGLIVTEGTAPSPRGKGSLRMPALYSDAHVAGWRKVTDAVHARGGMIVAQLMHSGRMAHSSRIGAVPVAPSAVRPAGQVATAAGMADYETPQALTPEGIAGIIGEYAQATRRALAAGFDGVELHGASGYLPMQFLSSSTNRRTDRYGGSAANRARFTVEALQAMAEVAGPGRVGLKLSPEFPHNDIRDDDPVETYTVLARALGGLRLAYLHVAQSKPSSADYHALLRPVYPGRFFAGGGLSRDMAEGLVRSARADAAVFGQLFLANPDLPERFRRNAPFNPPDRDTFYTPGPKGYIDYPFLEPRPA